MDEGDDMTADRPVPSARVLPFPARDRGPAVVPCAIALQDGALPRGVWEQPYYDESGAITLVAVTSAHVVAARAAVRTAGEYAAALERLRCTLSDEDPAPHEATRVVDFPTPAKWAARVSAAKRRRARASERRPAFSDVHLLTTMGRLRSLGFMLGNLAESLSDADIVALAPEMRPVAPALETLAEAIATISRRAIANR